MKRRSKSTVERRDSRSLLEAMSKKAKVTCEKYVVDMQAATFGTCTCGAARVDHTDAALGAGGVSAAVHRDDAEVRAKMVQRQVADCKEFRVSMDTNAAFGTCMCGRPRAEHTEAALHASNQHKSFKMREGADVRKTFKKVRGPTSAASTTRARAPNDRLRSSTHPPPALPLELHARQPPHHHAQALPLVVCVRGRLPRGTSERR